MDIERLLNDYEIDWDIFSETDERLRGYNLLPVPDKIILVLYAELKSYRKVGKLLGCSHQQVAKKLYSIKDKLC